MSILELPEQIKKGYSLRLNGAPVKDFVPPGFKPSPGSRLRVDSKGNVSYHNPECIREWRPGSKPFKLAALHGRVTDSDNVRDSLNESITKRALKVRGNIYLPMRGRPVGRGYHCVATDGYTALIQKGESEGTYSNVFENLWDSWKFVAEISDPEFHLAVKRSMLMCPESRKIQLFGNRDTVTVYSQDPSSGDYVGKVPAINGEFWRVALDARFIEPLCGVWPLYVNYAGPTKAIMFYPQTADWAYVVMPMRIK